MEVLNITNFSISLTKLQFYQIFDIYCHYPDFSGSGNEKTPLGVDNKLLENFFGPRLVFNLLIFQILAIFKDF